VSQRNPSKLGSKLQAYMFAPVDGAFLAALRVLYGALVFGSTLRMLILDVNPSSAYAGWVDAFFIRPTFHFKYWGFGWVQPPPGPFVYALLWALVVLSLAVAAGLWFRVTSVVLVVCLLYLELIDATFFVNHYYLLSLLGVLLAISPAHTLASVDAWRARRVATNRAAGATVSRIWLYLFRFQIAVVYTFAGLAKAHPDWLLHAQPLRIWLAAKTDLPVVGPLLVYSFVAPVMSWAGFLFDTAIPWLLSIRRIRPLAYALLIVFHVLTYLFFPRITMFPVIMVAVALVFFPPDWPRTLWARLRRDSPRAALPPPLVDTSGSHRSLGLWLCAAYCLIQVLVPLRFLAYGGDVRWHEQGLRFSWRVLHREKIGSVTFVVRSKRSGQTWHVDPEHYLHQLQVTEMSEQPDMILQLAHHIRDDFARRGVGPVSVQVRALATLNGRPSALLIDPEVDLAAVSDGLTPATWILPAPTTTPPHNRATL
jgi:vitamin K-dependent gamma-carboxylase